MKKRLLAMLLVLMLVVSLLPVGALAANSMSDNQYFTLDYDNGGVLDRTITVNLFDPDGKQIDTLTVNNAKGAQYNYTIALTSSISSQYDIEGMSITGGNPGSSSISNDSLSFWLGLTTEYDGCTVNVYLCPEYEAPKFPSGEINTDATIEYIAYEPALLKLLYVNDVTDVDEGTEIDDVTFNFVQDYTDNDWDVTKVPTGADNLMYFWTRLSDVADRGNPRNIRSIDILYTLSDGTEGTVRVYSGDLRYIKVDGDTYEIEANNDDTSIVAFYNEDEGELTTWSLYDVEFVTTGNSLGMENMPDDPTYLTYVFTNWDKNVNGGDPFLPGEIISDDTVVYAQKTSTDAGGTEFHVMNTNNELLDRVVEKYNAENDFEYEISDIEMDSVRIQVNGLDNKATNRNYWNNGWRSESTYYRVVNSGIVGNHETISNTHIPHNEVQSITVYAQTTGGQSIEVNIPIGADPGDISVSLVKDNIVEIHINDKPSAPSAEELEDTDPDAILGTGAVTVDCDNSEHDNKTYGLISGAYTTGSVEWRGSSTDGAYYYDITIDSANYAAYVSKYDADTNGDETHSVVTGEATSKTITLVYGTDGWEVYNNTAPVTINVTCDTGDPGEPTVPTHNVIYQWSGAPTDTVYNAYGEEVTLTLPENITGLAKGEGYTVDTTYTDETVVYTHDQYGIVTGTYTFSGWTDPNNGVMGEANVIVTGEWTYKEVPVDSHTITVVVVNGTATAEGLTDGTITVLNNGNVTINFTADPGYVLDTVTVDDSPANLTNSAYTFNNVTRDHTIEVVYATDSNGDDIPDYKQVIVYFEADENGSVDGELTQAFTDEDGDGTVTFTPYNVTPNASTGYAFDIWTKDNGEEGVNPFTPTTAAAGTTITYTAHFAKDEIGDEDGGDGIPDKYQVTVKYVAGDGGSIAENACTEEVLTIREDDKFVVSGTVLVSGSTAVANEGYEFSNWTKTENDGEAVETDYEASFGPITDMEVNGGDVITFTANFEAKTYGLDVEKTLVTVGNTMIGEGTEIPNANVGEQIIWNIKVTNTGNQSLSNITVTDNMVNASGTVVLTIGSDDTRVTIDGTTATISELEPGESVVITATYTVLANDVGKTLNNSVSVADNNGHKDGDTPDEDVTVSDYTVKITPADIIAYTGGTSYSVIVDGSGEEIGTATSGLPVPGYHIELSKDVQEWLGTATGQQLNDVITFTYNHDGETRTWNLSYVGVYSTDAQGQPETYVYELESTGGSPEVRLQFTDENGNVFYRNDDITMTEQTVNAEYSMTIYGGLLDQNYVEAQIKKSDGETITADVIIGTGTLTVLSTTNEEYTTDLNEDSSSRITADVNDGTTFTVNDSEVTLEPEDVKLLVDSVSNNDDFNAAIEDDARDHVSMYNAGTESFYLDLVHADNGNVQVGLDGSLTISWPMPDDADPDGEFTIVHYVDMDRSAVMGEDDLANADKERISVTPNGDQLVFNVESFSPFVLVYEAEERTPIIPIPDLDDDDDDDTEYVPKWLNTEDHFAYIVGYEDGEVKPNNNITRAEVATIFFRLLTDDARARYWS